MFYLFVTTGVEEAAAAGKALANENFKFDVAHTSLLTRAQETLKSILKGVGQENIPVEKTWRLNERHYGGLTGLDKAETAEKYGEAQVSKTVHFLFFLLFPVLDNSLILHHTL